MKQERDQGVTRISGACVRDMQPGQLLRDDVVPGLHIRCTGQKKSFYLYFKTKAGIQRRPKLGDAAVLTLADARRIAREILVTVAAGGDPMVERAQARSAPTVAELAERYMREHGSRKKTARDDRLRLDRIIVPKLGAKRVPDVEYEHIKALHDSLAATPYQANRVLALLSAMFNLAERPWKIRPARSNPCYGVRRYREVARRRYATPAELATIGALLEREAQAHPAAVAFIYLLAYSGARPSEIANAKWSQLERANVAGRIHGVLRIEDGKTGAIKVMLPPQAMAVLDKLKRTDGTITGIKSPKKLWGRIRKEAGCPDLRMRDLRRTFGTVALSSGQGIGVVGELLNHRSTQTTRIYAKLIEDVAHVAAGATADRVSALMHGGAEGGQRETAGT